MYLQSRRICSAPTQTVNIVRQLDAASHEQEGLQPLQIQRRNEIALNKGTFCWCKVWQGCKNLKYCLLCVAVKKVAQREVSDFKICKQIDVVAALFWQISFQSKFGRSQKNCSGSFI
jgi:hypothetical protein